MALYTGTGKIIQPLASDLMEEWRAVIVDATAMSLINGHEIHKDDFTTNMDEPGCYLTKSGLKIYLNKLERKLQTEVNYLSYVDYSVSFRRAIFFTNGTAGQSNRNGGCVLL